MTSAQGQATAKTTTMDDEESDVINHFRTVRSHGYGRVEVVVVAGKLDTINHTETFKRKGRIPDKAA